MTYNYLFNNPPKLYVALRDLYQLSFYFKNCTCKGVVLDGFGIATVEVEISSTVPCDIENSLIRIIFRSDCANECTILIDGHTNIWSIGTHRINGGHRFGYPQTWEELMDACEKVKAAGHIPVTTDSNYCTSWVGYYMSRRLGNDRVMELAKDSSQWASEQGIKDTAEAIAYMAAKGYFDPNIESNVYPAAQQDMVISENVAMYINGTWLPNEVAETTPDDFKWGAFAFPEVPNGVEGTECGCYSTYAIAVNKDCDDAATQAAVEFIVYLTTSEWDQEFTNQANAIPMNVDHVWPENLADAQVVLNSYTSRYPSQTAIITNSDSKQIIADACLKLMGGSISADEFIKMASAF